MVIRVCAAGVFVGSLLACGGLGGPAPTERAIALAETRVRSGYEDDVPTAVGFGDTMTLDWAEYTPEQPRTREIDGDTYLVVPYTWQSTSPIRQDYYKMNAIAWGSDGAELVEDHRKSKDTCEGDITPDQEVSFPPHYGGAIPNATAHCEFLFEINPNYADNVLFLIERDERGSDSQYIWHLRKDPWVMDLGPATPE